MKLDTIPQKQRDYRPYMMGRNCCVVRIFGPGNALLCLFVRGGMETGRKGCL